MTQRFLLILFIGATTTAFTQAFGQSPFVPLNTDYYHLIDRTEIRHGQWAEGFHSSMKPYSRQSVVQLLDSIQPGPDYQPSDTDLFNFAYLRDDSWEWAANPDNTGNSKRPVFGKLYNKKADFYSHKTADFDIHVNPVVSFGMGQDQVAPRVGAGELGILPASVGRPYISTRGAELRGNIQKRLGFYAFVADNQVIFPFYASQYRLLYGLADGNVGFAPGEGVAKPLPNNGADFITARGYITFNFLKIVNLQFGHDRNFIGNGFRSLLLSDNSAPYLFLKLTTQFGKFQYTNLFAEMTNSDITVPTTQPKVQKFATMHHLSMNVGRHLNIGLFESEIFSRDRLDLNYLNPVIFYRYVESYRGSSDNAFIGLDAKALLWNRVQVYGQFMLDEFLIDKLRAGTGSWVNKFAAQIGAKYVDVLGVPNLDLQTEFNLVRPYTYSHFGSQTNYTHFSQPLAHPMGANFTEALAIVRYQRKRLTTSGILSVIRYGADPSADQNYGGNIRLTYNTRVREEGNFIAQGRQQLTTFADLRLSYMARHNVFVDARYLYRFTDSQYRAASYTEQLASIALRWNLPYRNYVF
jgi:hypothetical protein